MWCSLARYVVLSTLLRNMPTFPRTSLHLLVLPPICEGIPDSSRTPDCATLQRTATVRAPTQLFDGHDMARSAIHGTSNVHLPNLLVYLALTSCQVIS